jgi:hypothetical protein
MTTTTDLSHTDWLLNSMKNLIIKVNSNISTVIVTDSNNKKTLLVNNVSESDIDKIYFITNTDQNNNYLYIDNFSVYIDNYPSPVPFPGLNETVLNVFRDSDVSSFIAGQKVHYPFNALLYQQDCSFKGTTFSQFVDFLSSATPLSPNTAGTVKTYGFIVYPDLPTCGNSSC